MDVKSLETMLYNESGLKGISGFSGDMRTLLASDDPNAKLAIGLFIFRLVREIGALAASLEGLDGLVFTAGIGEHAPAIRALAVTRLGWLGAKLDDAANKAGASQISGADSRVAIYVIPTNEEEMIARHALRALERG